jgi:hypothetical protein
LRRRPVEEGAAARHRLDDGLRPHDPGASAIRERQFLVSRRRGPRDRRPRRPRSARRGTARPFAGSSQM